jgi:hypothetical protein
LQPRKSLCRPVFFESTRIDQNHAHRNERSTNYQDRPLNPRILSKTHSSRYFWKKKKILNPARPTPPNPPPF